MVRRNNWNSSAVIVKLEGENLKYLVQDSRSLLRQWVPVAPQTKCIGGGAKTQDQDPRMTLGREIWEEIFLYISREARIHRIGIVFEGRHQKYFDLIRFSDLVGKMRDRNAMLIDGNSLLYNLRFIGMSEVEETVFHVHAEMIRKANQDIIKNPGLVG